MSRLEHNKWQLYILQAIPLRCNLTRQRPPVEIMYVAIYKCSHNKTLNIIYTVRGPHSFTMAQQHDTMHNNSTEHH